MRFSSLLKFVGKVILWRNSTHLRKKFAHGVQKVAYPFSRSTRMNIFCLLICSRSSLLFSLKLVAIITYCKFCSIYSLIVIIIIIECFCYYDCKLILFIYDVYLQSVLFGNLVCC